MTRSLALDRTAWDLVLDSAGNIAIVSAPYSVAQDVACALRLFRGELFYDVTQGVPYFDQILGQFPSIPFIKAQFIAAAFTVPSVVSAQCFVVATSGRQVLGQVQVTDNTGSVSVVTASSAPIFKTPFDLDVSVLGGGDVLG